MSDVILLIIVYITVNSMNIVIYIYKTYIYIFICRTILNNTQILLIFMKW